MISEDTRQPGHRRAAEFETYDRSVLKNDVLYAFFMNKNRVKNVLQ